MAANKIKQTKGLRDVWFNRLRELQEVAEAALNDVTARNLFKIRFLDIDGISTQFQIKHFTLIEYLVTIDGADLAPEEEVRSEFDRIFYLIKEIYNKLFEIDTQPMPELSQKVSNVKLPKIDLPKFDGNLKDWPSFLDLYKSLIHDNKTLSNSEKFQYLLSCLSKNSLAVVKAVPLTDDNYEIAYKTLIDRYQNNRLLASTYWQEIMDAPKLNTDSSLALRNLLECFSENLEALRKFNLPVDSWSFVLFNILIKKLDLETVKRFELHYASTEIPTYESLVKFLLDQCTALESVSLSSPTVNRKNENFNFKKSSNSSNKVFSRSHNNSSCLVNSMNTSTPNCALCNSVHPLYKCSAFQNKDAIDRYNFAKQKRLCINCLQASHRSSTCRSQSSCRLCQARHHTLLHFNRSTSEPTSTSSPSTSAAHVDTSSAIPTSSINLVSSPSNSQPVNSLANLIPSKTTVLLSTAILEVLDIRGNFQKVRVLLDCASQASFMTSSCCNRLGLPRSRLSLSINGLAHMSSQASAGVTCIIRPVGQLSPSLTVETVVIPKICTSMPTTYIPVSSWSHLTNIKLADPEFNIPKDVDMLLGADVFPSVVIGEPIQGNLNEPTAFETIFGWVLMGKINCQSSTSINSFCSVLNSLDFDLKSFWEIEEVPKHCNSTPEELQCEKLFLESHSRDSSGRYTVALPFNNGEPSFLETRSIALRRLFSLERRLTHDSSLYEAYKSFLKEYLEAGHMERVTSPPLIPSKCFYIPHHCVVKPESASTKLRVVFDASCSPPGGQSLNDTLLTGPKLQQDLTSLLLHFRLHRFVFTADIRQMYRQIMVKSTHRDYQRILWRFAPHESVQEFRLNTVTYGVKSAPFLAIRTLLQLSQDEYSDFPRASKILSSDIYVDDLVTGDNSLDAAKTLQEDLIRLLARGGFELRKWTSNHPSLLVSIPKQFQYQQSLSFDNEENSSVKILGMKWLPSTDSFSYNVDTSERRCTKRTILSDIARIYDPLGFLSPVTFFAKYFMQQLWTRGLKWDDELPSDLSARWINFKGELSKLSLINVPRYFGTDQNSSCQLHGFSDSSEKGYSAVVYIRFVKLDGNIKTLFVCAKTKVAPLKKLSLPRLELCAAVLLSDLLHFISNIYANKLNISEIHAWSDSTVALTWIKSPPHRWKTFVGNRVSHIQEIVSPACWHHINTKENPADCASRGIFPSDLLSHSLWWAGPLFLQDSSWSISDVPNEDTSLVILEEKKVVFSTYVSLNTLDSLLERFSSLPKIQRIISYCLRFCHNLSSPERKGGIFTSYDLHRALLVLIKHVQQLSFSDELHNLRNGKSLSKSFRKLSPFLDSDGLLRVGGRLTNSYLSFDQKHPILLPRKHRLTELIIQDVHSQHLHPGLQTLRFLISQNYWILNAKHAIRSVLAKCIKCFRTRPTALTPYMGSLPKLRVSQLKPFSCVGTDFCGPYHVTLGKARGCKSQKAYICLFVCFATKAVHLELVSDLSSEAFLAALRRFIARRGRCSVIHSDCGTNFVGANNYLTQIMQNAAETEKIKWQFNPPSAPHFGGLWEAGVKSVKGHLLRVIGEQILTFEELYTVLVQIEALLNSRPLSELSTDPNDLNALTPGHFLTLEPLTVLPDPDLTHLAMNRLTRWQLLQRLHQDFWKRWHIEYLHTLMQRQKWLNGQSENLTIGKLVLIKDDLSPPLRWCLGRITETHCGADGICRVATVKTANGTFQRPVVKLCPLPSQ